MLPTILKSQCLTTKFWTYWRETQLWHCEIVEFLMPAEIQKCHKPTMTTTNVEIKGIDNSRFGVCPSRCTVHINTITIFTLFVPFQMSGAKENIEQHSFHTLLCDLLPSPSQLAYSCTWEQEHRTSTNWTMYDHCMCKQREPFLIDLFGCSR